MNNTDELTYDVAIIGGGPAGLSCAIYTARAKLRTVVLDKSPSGGSLAQSTKIANYPGVKGPVPGSTLLDTMREQAVSFGCEYRKTAVIAVDFHSEPKALYATDGVFRARAVVIATGSRGRAEKIEGEEKFLGRGVGYCATCDAAFYEGKTVAVVGYDDIAVEEAILVARFARRVLLVCPKSQLNASEHLLNKLSAVRHIEVLLGASPRRIIGDQFVKGLVVRRRSHGEEVLPVDGVFMLLGGTAPVTDFLGDAVRLSPEGCVEVDCNQATNIAGVYAAGDVTCIHPRQAIIAAAEGVIAALQVDKYLRGAEAVKPDYT
jgi:thioredoxin reductase (NADPH)